MFKQCTVLFCFLFIFSNAFCEEYTYNGSTKNIDLEVTDEDEGNTVSLNKGTYEGETIVAGRNKGTGNSTDNTLVANEATIKSKTVVGGISTKADAIENTVTMDSSHITQGTLVGGISEKGNASTNEVTLYKTQVDYMADSYIAGGEIKDTSKESASENTVTLSDASTVDTNVYGGYSKGSGSSNYNTVLVEGKSTAKNTSGTSAIYGGYSAKGTAYNNTVEVTDNSVINTDLIGGYSAEEAVYKNEIVTQNATTITGNIYGGSSNATKDVTGNTVSLSAKTQFTGSKIMGGYNLSSGNVASNSVKISGSTLTNSTEVYGGYATSGNANSNSVVLNANTVGSVYGGYSASGTASNNSVSVSNVVASSGNFVAGKSDGGEANSNSLSFSNVSLGTSTVAAGMGATSSSNNTITALNSAMGNVYGGQSTSGNADNNKVTITGGSASSVYGGYGATGASGNTVELNNVAVNGNVYGGYSTSGDTQNNTVHVAGSTTISSGKIYGGNGASNTGNSLLLENYVGGSIAANTFENITVQGLNSNVTFDESVTAGITLVGRPSTEKKTLVHTNSSSNITLNNENLGVYKYNLIKEASGSGLDWSVQGGFQKELARPYSQIQVASLAAARMGDAVLRPVFEEALTKEPEKDISIFADIRYDDDTYKIGKDFDLESVTAQFGNWIKLQNSAWGWFARYVHSQYKYEPADADGNINTLSLGGFYLLPYSDQGRFEFIIRGGYQYTNLEMPSVFSSSKRENAFAGGSVGIVQNVSCFQFLGKLNYVNLFGNSTHDDLDQSVKFGNAQSLQGEIGARLNFGSFGHFLPYLTVGSIYEMLGDSSVKIDGYKAPTSSLQGLTGQGEIGFAYDNPNAILPLRTELAVFGKIGRVEGWGLNLRLAFSF